jgi:hypothetical protein
MPSVLISFLEISSLISEELIFKASEIAAAPLSLIELTLR